MSSSPKKAQIPVCFPLLPSQSLCYFPGLKSPGPRSAKFSLARGSTFLALPSLPQLLSSAIWHENHKQMGMVVFQYNFIYRHWKLNFTYFFTCHETVFFFWFFSNHLHRQKPALACGLYKTRWWDTLDHLKFVTVSPGATGVCWLHILVSGCLKPP